MNVQHAESTVMDPSQCIITKALINEWICGADESKKAYEFGFTLARVFAILGVILLIIPFLGILCLGLACLFYALASKKMQLYTEIKNLNYWLSEDICLNKTEEDDPDHDPYTWRYFHLKCHGKVELTFPDVPFYLTHHQSHDLYNNTNHGDTVYLLCSSKKKILYIFHSKYWQLDKNDFARKENNGNAYYIPIK